MVLYALLACVGYLVGSVQFGLIIGRLARGVDIRDFGSGNTGFTNSLRTLGPGWSVAVLAGDFLKGALPVLLANLVHREFGGNLASLQVVAATATVLGHIWPLYAQFRGGKGVATALGATFVMMPLIGIFLLLVAGSLIYVFRYMSLGSLVAAPSATVLVWVMILAGRLPLAYGIWGIVITAILLFSHRENLQRLRSGTERKIGESAQSRTNPGNVSP
jgi:acyl phosphate:glycerol-3-phosphate acyltransferase